MKFKIKITYLSHILVFSSIKWGWYYLSSWILQVGYIQKVAKKLKVELLDAFPMSTVSCKSGSFALWLYVPIDLVAIPVFSGPPLSARPGRSRWGQWLVPCPCALSLELRLLVTLLQCRGHLASSHVHLGSRVCLLIVLTKAVSLVIYLIRCTCYHITFVSLLELTCSQRSNWEN